MRREAATAVTAVMVGWMTVGELRAQSPSADDLDRVEAAIDEGRLDGLRQTLDGWLAGGDDLRPEDAGRLRFLRARLLADADSARDEYLAVALDGRSSYGAHAWLRLAQLDLARGEIARALEDLTRMRADYSRSAIVPASWYWTGRASESAGDLEGACEAFARARREAAATGDQPTAESAEGAARACVEDGLRFALQIGAFSARNAAEALVTAAKSAGFDARIVREEGLEKVRVGVFGSPDAARALEKRLRAEGFTVVIVAAGS